MLLIDLFKDICEVLQEFFVFFELKVKDDFLEVSVEKFALIFSAHHLHDLFTAHFPRGLDTLLFHELGYLLLGDWLHAALIPK